MGAMDEGAVGVGAGMLKVRMPRLPKLEPPPGRASAPAASISPQRAAITAYRKADLVMALSQRCSGSGRRSYGDGRAVHKATKRHGPFERWTGGRIKTTRHRVLSPGRPRHSIPFFYEPRVDAIIEPLSLAGIEAFEPFVYGDHLWQAMLKFPTYKGMDALRKTRGTSRAA
jgi:hypothetical protein